MQLPAKHQNTTKRTILIAVITLLVLLGGYAAYAMTNSTWPFTKHDTSSDQPKTTITTTPKDATNPSTKDTSPTNHTPVQNDTPPNDKKSDNKLTGVITTKSVANGELVLRTTINQLLNKGTCDLALTNSSTGKVVKRSAPIIANPSSSTCEGFNIPLSELGSGSWNITINLTSGDRTGQITGSAKT